MALFRSEAMAARGGRLEGEVALAVPLAWRLTGAVLFALVAGAALYITLATTAREVRVPLRITRDGLRGQVPLASAGALAPGACGSLLLRTQDDAPRRLRVCLIGYDGGIAIRPTRSGIGQLVRPARFSADVPPLAPGAAPLILSARFAIGRRRLIEGIL